MATLYMSTNLRTVFVSCGRFNKWPQPWWLKRTQVSSFTSSKPEVWNQYHWSETRCRQGCPSCRGTRREPGSCAFQLLSDRWYLLVCGCHTPVSASVFTSPPPRWCQTSVCLSLIRTLEIHSGPTWITQGSTPISKPSTRSYLRRLLFFQIR